MNKYRSKYEANIAKDLTDRNIKFDMKLLSYLTLSVKKESVVYVRLV